MSYVPPPHPDPQLEAKYGRRAPSDMAGSSVYGIIGFTLLMIILALIVRVVL